MSSRLLWLTGVALLVLTGALSPLPAGEAFEVALLAMGAAAVVAVAGLTAIAALGPRSARTQAAVAGLTCVVGVALGSWFAARRMFVSSHDLAVLQIVLAAAALAGLTVAELIGQNFTRSVRSLVGAARRLAGPGAAGGTPPAPTTSTLPRGASREMAGLAAELDELGRCADGDGRVRDGTREERTELAAWIAGDGAAALAHMRARLDELRAAGADPAGAVDDLHADLDRVAGAIDDLIELAGRASPVGESPFDPAFERDPADERAASA